MQQQILYERGQHFNNVICFIKFLQGSAITQTVLGGLTIDPPVANFL